MPPPPPPPAAAAVELPPVDARINHADAKAYWATIAADENGMLGGFAYISRVDLQGSRNFLARLGVGGPERRSGRRGQEGLIPHPREGMRAVDCGAGIGRVTEGLLLGLYETVDIVEPVAKFSDSLRDKEGVGRVWNVGLEDWNLDGGEPDEDMRYDLMWNQWCLGQLTDAQLVDYLQRCGRLLRPGGWIIVKENTSTSDGDVFDEADNSVTRLDKKFREIFQKAGMKIKRTELQKGFPKGLFPVRIYALQPAGL